MPNVVLMIFGSVPWKGDIGEIGVIYSGTTTANTLNGANLQLRSVEHRNHPALMSSSARGLYPAKKAIAGSPRYRALRLCTSEQEGRTENRDQAYGVIGARAGATAKSAPDGDGASTRSSNQLRPILGLSLVNRDDGGQPDFAVPLPISFFSFFPSL